VNAMMGGMELDERRSLSGLLDQLKANLRDSSGVDTK